MRFCLVNCLAVLLVYTLISVNSLCNPFVRIGRYDFLFICYCCLIVMFFIEATLAPIPCLGVVGLDPIVEVATKLLVTLVFETSLLNFLEVLSLQVFETVAILD